MATHVELIRDMLDKEVVDRHGREMGRVDSIVIAVRPNRAPQVTAIELGPAVLAYRVRPVLGRLMSAVEHALGIDEGRPLRIPFGDILGIHRHIKVDRAFGETVAATLEQRLRAWVGALPGSS
jgi:sporulation protein YlmC with PRC-barrel domain